MKIELSDIEPVLAQRVRDEAEQIAEALRTGGRLLGWTPFHAAIKVCDGGKETLRKGMGCIVPATIGLVTFLLARTGTAIGLQLLAIGLMLVGALFVYRNYDRRIGQVAEAKFVSHGLPVVARSKEEKLYCELIEELSKASAGTEDAARSLLREMNALMGSYRTLERRGEDAKKAMANRSVEGLESELRGLQKRAEAATDPVAREALEQSVQLCASRIESAKALTVAQERAKSQQEVVLQTLGSVHAAFAHMRNAPNEVHFEAAQLLETVNDLQGRTRAVEKAVEELISVRTG